MVNQFDFGLAMQAIACQVLKNNGSRHIFDRHVRPLLRSYRQAGLNLAQICELRRLARWHFAQMRVEHKNGVPQNHPLKSHAG